MSASDRLYNTVTASAQNHSIYAPAPAEKPEPELNDFFSKENILGRDAVKYSAKNVAGAKDAKDMNYAHESNTIRIPDPAVLSKYSNGEFVPASPVRIVEHRTHGSIDQKKNPDQTHRG
jgi:hypothetical protein